MRKSDSCTRPTVCDLSRSSAVEACDVKREVALLAVVGLGVLLREGSAEEGLERSMVGGGVWRFVTREGREGCDDGGGETRLKKQRRRERVGLTGARVAIGRGTDGV